MVMRRSSPPARSGTVLVTGAGGFVGSAVVRALVNARRGAAAGAMPTFADGSPVTRVVAMLRPAGSAERLEELEPSDDWAIARADLTDTTGLAAMLTDVRPRVILHLAMDREVLADPGDEAHREFIDRPLESLFMALKGVPNSRIVTTGSVAVLRPGDALHEDSFMEPNQSYLNYSKAKMHEERMIAAFGEATGVSWLHLRLFYIFGKYEARTRLLPHIVGHLARNEPAELSSGDQVRDFTDVEDVAVAYVRALGAGDDRGGRTYHVGSGKGISVRAFAESVAQVVGRPDLLRFGVVTSGDREKRAIIADVGRIRRELGWAADPDTTACIRRAAGWWLARFREHSRQRGGRVRGRGHAERGGG